MPTAWRKLRGIGPPPKRKRKRTIIPIPNKHDPLVKSRKKGRPENPNGRFYFTQVSFTGLLSRLLLRFHLASDGFYRHVNNNCQYGCGNPPGKLCIYPCLRLKGFG